MPEKVLEALQVLSIYCLEQDSCSTCPMRDYCGKLPSEYQDLD